MIRHTEASQPSKTSATSDVNNRQNFYTVRNKNDNNKTIDELQVKIWEIINKFNKGDNVLNDKIYCELENKSHSPAFQTNLKFFQWVNSIYSFPVGKKITKKIYLKHALKENRNKSSIKWFFWCFCLKNRIIWI